MPRRQIRRGYSGERRGEDERLHQLHPLAGRRRKRDRDYRGHPGHHHAARAQGQPEEDQLDVPAGEDQATDHPRQHPVRRVHGRPGYDPPLLQPFPRADHRLPGGRSDRKAMCRGLPIRLLRSGLPVETFHEDGGDAPRRRGQHAGEGRDGHTDRVQHGGPQGRDGSARTTGCTRSST